MLENIDLVAIETAVLESEKDIDLVIVEELGYHCGKAGGVPPFLANDVKKIRRRLNDKMRKDAQNKAAEKASAKKASAPVGKPLAPAESLAADQFADDFPAAPADIPPVDHSPRFEEPIEEQSGDGEGLTAAPADIPPVDHSPRKPAKKARKTRAK